MTFDASSRNLTVKHALQMVFAAGLAFSAAVGCDVDDSVMGNDNSEWEGTNPNPNPGGGGGGGGSVVGEGEWKMRVGQPNGCDLTGKWIAQIITVSSALGAEATSYNWYYYDITDNGDTATINRGWDCSFEVCGTSTVFPLGDTSDALVQRNRQDGELDAVAGVRVAPRKVTYKPDSDGYCLFEMERWWWLRGLDTTNYYPPRDRFDDMTHQEMNQLVPLPSKTNQAGNQDWDSDGYPGIYLTVQSPAQGFRNVVHRDWNEYGPARIPDGATNFIVPADFDAQEVVFNAEPSLLDQLSQSTHDFNRVRFIRLPDDTDPPTDVAGFRDWCEVTVAENFRPGQCANQVEELDRWMYFRELFQGAKTPAPYPY